MHMKLLHAATAANRISDSTVLMGGALCGVLGVSLMLSLALSSPYPTLKQGDWGIQPASSRPASIHRLPNPTGRSVGRARPKPSVLEATLRREAFHGRASLRRTLPLGRAGNVHRGVGTDGLAGGDDIRRDEDATCREVFVCGPMEPDKLCRGGRGFRCHARRSDTPGALGEARDLAEAGYAATVCRSFPAETTGGRRHGRGRSIPVAGLSA